MNRVMFTAIVLAGVLIVWFIAGLIARARATQRKAKVVGWDDWTLEQRAACHKELILDLVEEDADRWQAFITFVLSVIIIGTMSLITLQNNTNQIAAVAHANCIRDNAFRELISARVTSEIRQTQQRRDALADSMAGNNGPSPEDTPGFDDLDPTVQVFVRTLTDQAAGRNRGQLAIYDQELTRLRSEADAVRRFNAATDCPG
jgi:hypothetical protein